jgi:hypothetical protein
MERVMSALPSSELETGVVETSDHARARLALGRGQGDVKAAITELIDCHHMSAEDARLAVRDALDLRLSDAGNAKRFVYDHGRELRYAWPWGSG